MRTAHREMRPGRAGRHASPRPAAARGAVPSRSAQRGFSLLELIAWFEATYQIRIPDSDMTIDNLGSTAQMADYLLRSKASR